MNYRKGEMVWIKDDKHAPKWAAIVSQHNREDDTYWVERPDGLERLRIAQQDILRLLTMQEIRQVLKDLPLEERLKIGGEF